MKKIFITINFFIIFLFFLSPIFCTKKEQISNNEFLNHCDEFSKNLETILQNDSVEFKNDKTQKEKINELFTDFLKTISLYKSSQNFQLSSFYKMEQTEKVLELENVINDFLEGKISQDQAAKKTYKLLFEFSNYLVFTDKKTTLLSFQLLWILVISIIAIASFAVLYFTKQNELLKIKIEKTQKEIIAQSIITSLEKNKNHISTELHDTIAQDIKAEQFFVSTLISTISKTKENNELIEKINFLENKINTQIRSLIKNLSTPKISNLTFNQALNDFCTEISSINNINCNFYVGEEVEIDNQKKYSLETRQQIFRIIQESVTNAVKHSDCTEINILIRMNKSNKLTIFITDDGKGFVPEKINTKNSFGIKGIKARAAIIKAKLSIESEKDNGTTVKLEL